MDDRWSHPPGEEELTLDRIVDVLSNRRRRAALRVLGSYDEELTLADLADEVAMRERGAPLTEISAETVKRTYLSLYHAHIPKLREVGLLDYHQEGDLVVPTDRTSLVVETWLPLLDEHGDPLTSPLSSQR